MYASRPPFRIRNLQAVFQGKRAFFSVLSLPRHETLQPSVDSAMDLVKRYDPAGHLPGRLLPVNDMRIAYFAVRGFWIETGLRVDSTARVGARSLPSEQLEWWKGAVDQIYNDSHANKEDNDFQTHPTVLLLQDLRRKHKWRREYFDDILKGRILDLNIKQYSDVKEMEEHAEWSCGSLMKLILESGGIDDVNYPVSHKAAKILGKSHGIANALRTSIPVMSGTGKLIIPQELCDRYGVKSPRYLLSALGQGDQKCIYALREAIKDVAKQSIGYLEEARSLRQEILAEAGPKGKHVMGVFLPILATETFLNRLKEHNYDLTNRQLRNVSLLEHGRCSLRIIKASMTQTF